MIWCFLFPIEGQHFLHQHANISSQCLLLNGHDEVILVWCIEIPKLFLWYEVIYDIHFETIIELLIGGKESLLNVQFLWFGMECLLHKTLKLEMIDLIERSHNFVFLIQIIANNIGFSTLTNNLDDSLLFVNGLQFGVEKGSNSEFICLTHKKEPKIRSEQTMTSFLFVEILHYILIIYVESKGNTDLCVEDFILHQMREYLLKTLQTGNWLH